MDISPQNLCCDFLGLTEEQVDSCIVRYPSLQKIRKSEFEQNVVSILYALDDERYFLLIIDHNQDDIVVMQRTWWTNIEEIYRILKNNAISGKKRSDSPTGFYIHKSFVKDDVLIDLESSWGDGTWLAASINKPADIISNTFDEVIKDFSLFFKENGIESTSQSVDCRYRIKWDTQNSNVDFDNSIMFVVPNDYIKQIGFEKACIIKEGVDGIHHIYLVNVDTKHDFFAKFRWSKQLFGRKIYKIEAIYNNYMIRLI